MLFDRIAKLAITVFGLCAAAPVLAQTANGAPNVERAATVRQAILPPAIATMLAVPGVVTVFGTLDAAVAAQVVPDTLSEDLACMAGAVYFESKGEPLGGQLAVAQVILNRSKSGRFPSSVCSVVTQPGQFSFVRGGRIPAIAASKQYRTAVAVARVALAAAWDGVASGAMFFHARRVSPNWHRVQVAAIGNHLFYR